MIAYLASGFQGGLQWYRCTTERVGIEELERYAGATIDVPSCFIGGANDWGVHQAPGVYERMQRQVCTHLHSCELLAGAGHWVAQEQPTQLAARILDFLATAPISGSAEPGFRRSPAATVGSYGRPANSVTPS